MLSGTRSSRSIRATTARRTGRGRGRRTDLDAALARQEERVLSKALTFSCGGTKYCVKTAGPGTAMRGAKIAVHHFTDGADAVLL